eukprot:1785631-Rhodomonas_salina.1
MIRFPALTSAMLLIVPGPQTDSAVPGEAGASASSSLPSEPVASAAPSSGAANAPADAPAEVDDYQHHVLYSDPEDLPVPYVNRLLTRKLEKQVCLHLCCNATREEMLTSVVGG